jgi:sec-independent protein translocase protein TatA
VDTNARYSGAVPNIGTGELLLILLVVLLVFGSTKLPKLARSMGQAQTEFKRGIREGHTAEDDESPSDKA